MEWLSPQRITHLALGLAGGAVAAAYMRLATWRSLITALVASALLATTAPEPMAHVLGLPASAHPMLAVVFGLAGRALADRISAGEIRFWK